MKHLFAFLFLLVFLGITWKETFACGHESWFVGAGYTQLLQYSPDRAFVAPGLGGIPPKIDWRTRFGGYGKIGKDFCGSRFGFELPVQYNKQKLNRSEFVHLFGFDLNALIHLVETRKGLDFYWIAGMGVNHVSEGRIKDNTKNTGMNFNLGPGIQYFIHNKRPKIGIGISIPFKYTYYFGNRLSRSGTSVFGLPINIGLTFGF